MTRKGVWLVMTLTAYAFAAFGVGDLKSATEAAIVYAMPLLTHWLCS